MSKETRLWLLIMLLAMALVALVFCRVAKGEFGWNPAENPVLGLFYSP